jgi:hypothetical protein
MTSFLPPNAGYFGGALCISSLIALVILNVDRKCSESENPLHTLSTAHDVGQQQIAPTILVKHQTGDVARRTRGHLRIQNIKQSRELKMSNPSVTLTSTSTEPLPSLSLAIPELPDEIYAHIFTYLEGHSVSSASRVCLRWSKLASVEELWMKFCAQEAFCSPAGELAFSYKKAYQDSKIFKKDY